MIVGGDGGIGKACAERLRARGDAVVVIDRARDQDATDPASVRAALRDHDAIDVVVHAAGSVGRGGIEDGTTDEWRTVLDDNVLSAMVVAQVCLPRMSRGGSLTLLSSVNGRHGGNRLSGPAYAVAKAGLIGLTRHLAVDQAPRGVRVNAVAPGPVMTPMLERLSENQVDELRRSIPLATITEPEEIAAAVDWLASEEARSVTGAVIDVNGGMWMG